MIVCSLTLVPSISSSREDGAPRTDQSQCGQVLLELAIILPFLIMVVISLFEIGVALNTYLKLSRIVQEGARVGSMTSDLEAMSCQSSSCVCIDISTTGPCTIATTPDNRRFSTLCNDRTPIPINHESVQGKMCTLLALEQPTVELEDLFTQYTRASAGGCLTPPCGDPGNDTVYVRLRAEYRGIFMNLWAFPFVLEARTGYLYEN